MGGPVQRPAPPLGFMGEPRFPDRARRTVWAPPEPLPWWVRHPHLGSLLLWSAIIGLALLLGGCECGVGWPCPK